MTYYEDLSPYAYSGTSQDGTLNVGWLSRGHAFPTGSAEAALLKGLATLAASPVNVMRGCHICPFCHPDPYGEMTASGEVEALPHDVAVHEGEEVLLGNAEIHVRGADARVFAAPTLIHHYVDRHDYLPPAIFVEAVAMAVADPARRVDPTPNRVRELRAKWAAVQSASSAKRTGDSDRGPA